MTCSIVSRVYLWEADIKYTKELLDRLFIYDETSPSGLIRKEPVYRGRNNASIQIPAGSVVGVKEYRRNGPPHAWFTKIKGKKIGVHIIIYVLVHGEIEEGLVIDHVDRNPFNNSVLNLRAVSTKLNGRNRTKSKLNTSGVTGVLFDNNKGTEYWIATWYDDIRQYRKRFSVKIYGYDLAKQLASEFRSLKLKELNGLGFGYTETHGM